MGFTGNPEVLEIAGDKYRLYKRLLSHLRVEMFKPPGWTTVPAPPEPEGFKITLVDSRTKKQWVFRDKDLVKGERPKPPLDVKCDGTVQFVFDYYLYPPQECEGEYQAELNLRVVGGHLGGLQIGRLGGSASASQTDGAVAEAGKEVGNGIIGAGEFRGESPAGSGNYKFIWPAQKRPCGWYQVTLEMPTSDFPITVNSPQTISITHPGQHKTVTFEAIVYPGAGAEPPKKPERAAPGAPPALVPPSGETATPGAQVPEEFPMEGGIEIPPAEMPVAEMPLDDLSLYGTADIDPLGALTGPPDLGKQAIALPSPGTPWTLLDMIVDPDASQDAQSAIRNQDIYGVTIVRGQFDGRLERSIPGP